MGGSRAGRTSCAAHKATPCAATPPHLDARARALAAKDGCSDVGAADSVGCEDEDEARLDAPQQACQTAPTRLGGWRAQPCGCRVWTAWLACLRRASGNHEVRTSYATTATMTVTGTQRQRPRQRALCKYAGCGGALLGSDCGPVKATQLKTLVRRSDSIVMDVEQKS